MVVTSPAGGSWPGPSVQPLDGPPPCTSEGVRLLSSDSTERSNQRDSNVRRRYVASSWFAGRYGTLRTERKDRNPHEFRDTARRGETMIVAPTPTRSSRSS